MCTILAMIKSFEIQNNIISVKSTIEKIFSNELVLLPFDHLTDDVGESYLKFALN